MAEYRLSGRADLDLADILGFSIERFGLERAEKYKISLYLCLRRVADHPRLGRRLTGRAKAYLRYACQRHVIFFTIDADGIFVVRVLHASMDHRQHLP
jgi:toxin ParE1/3/4